MNRLQHLRYYALVSCYRYRSFYSKKHWLRQLAEERMK